jgi:hypothetical protein
MDERRLAHEPDQAHEAQGAEQETTETHHVDLLRAPAWAREVKRS